MIEPTVIKNKVPIERNFRDSLTLSIKLIVSIIFFSTSKNELLYKNSVNTLLSKNTLIKLEKKEINKPIKIKYLIEKTKPLFL